MNKSEPSIEKPKIQPPYAIIIENDDKHTLDYVIETLRKVFGYDEQKCFKFAMTIHNAGKANVWSGSLELAELKRDQIRGAGPDRYAQVTVRFPLSVQLVPLR